MGAACSTCIAFSGFCCHKMVKIIGHELQLVGIHILLVQPVLRSQVSVGHKVVKIMGRELQLVGIHILQ